MDERYCELEEKNRALLQSAINERDFRKQLTTKPALRRAKKRTPR